MKNSRSRLVPSSSTRLLPPAAALLTADSALTARQPFLALRTLAQASTKDKEARSLIFRSIEMLKAQTMKTFTPDLDKAVLAGSLAGSEASLSQLAVVFQADPAFRRQSATVKGIKLVSPVEERGSDSFVIDSIIECLVQEVQNGAEEDGILTQLMDLSRNKQWLSGLTPNATRSLISCIASLIHGAEADRLTFTRASRGQPIDLLLSLFAFTQHEHVQSSEILALILSFVSQENLLVKAEAFHVDLGERKTVQQPTDLIKNLLNLIRDSIPSITQPCTIPKLGAQGKVTGYIASRTPLPSSKEGDACQLEMWISVLQALSASSKSVCRELYRRGAVDFLDDCLDLQLPPSVLSAIEKAYGAIACHCELLAMDVPSTDNLVLLCGVSLAASHSKSTTLALAALDRISSLVESCSTSSFLQLFKPGGVIHCSYSLLSSFIGSKPNASTSPKGGGKLHPWTAAVTMSLASPSNPQVIQVDFSAQHATTFKDCCRSLFTNSMERARRMEGKKRQESSVGPGKLRIPCYGFLAFLRPRDVILVERQLKNDETSTLFSIPCSKPIGAPAGGEGVKKTLVRHPSPTSPLDGSMSFLSQGSSSSSEDLEWTQTESEITCRVVLPRRAKKEDVTLEITSDALCVKLGSSIVLQGALRNRVESSQTIWTFDRESSSIDLLLVKSDKGHYWRSLFLGGVEKSHMTVLQEALASDEPIDETPEARELLASLREKQAQVVDGRHCLESSFDDFRLVLGDEML